MAFCPDLAFGLPIKRNYQRPKKELSDSHPVLALSPIVFGRPGSWPTAQPELFNRYWREFTSLARLLLDENYCLRLLATDHIDQLLAKTLYDQLSGSVTDKSRLQLLPLLKLEELIEVLQTCGAVIASRLHGVVLSHISGVPVLSVSYHRKVRAHMEDMGQQRFCMDFETFTASEAQRSLTTLLAERAGIVSSINVACTDRLRAVEKEFILAAGGLVPRKGRRW